MGCHPPSLCDCVHGVLPDGRLPLGAKTYKYFHCVVEPEAVEREYTLFVWHVGESNATFDLLLRAALNAKDAWRISVDPAISISGRPRPVLFRAHPPPSCRPPCCGAATPLQTDRPLTARPANLSTHPAADAPDSFDCDGTARSA